MNKSTAQARNALQVIVLISCASSVLALVLLFSAFQTWAWQLFGLVGVALVVSLAGFASILLFWRGRPGLAVRFLLVVLNNEQKSIGLWTK